MLIYNMTIDSAMSTDDVETFWTNRRDANRMNFTFQSIFSPSTLNFPSRPNYIIQHAFGITEADVNVVVTKLNNEGKFTIRANIKRHLKNSNITNLSTFVLFFKKYILCTCTFYPRIKILKYYGHISNSLYIK